MADEVIATRLHYCVSPDACYHRLPPREALNQQRSKTNALIASQYGRIDSRNINTNSSNNDDHLHSHEDCEKDRVYVAHCLSGPRRRKNDEREHTLDTPYDQLSNQPKTSEVIVFTPPGLGA